MEKLTYIDLFAGCGGLSLGLYNAGWHGLFAIEKSPLAFSTLEYNLINKLNHFSWPKWLARESHDIDEVLKKHSSNLKNLRNKVDMVAGGPPCQGFSTAGKRQEDDSRNGLIKSYIKFIRLVQPKIIFFENVRGFTQRFEKNKTKGKRYSEYVITSLSRSGKNFKGYHVVSQLVDFSQYGIPQKRTRFILVGVRKDIMLNAGSDFFNKINQNKEKFLINKGLSIDTTLADAISDLLMQNGQVSSPDSNGFQAGKYGEATTPYQKLLRKNLDVEATIPDSHRFANHSEKTVELFDTLLNSARRCKRITGEERQQFNLKKRGITVLNPHAASATLTSHPDDYVHYSEPRILTVREYARIQSFPDWYKFKGKYTTGGVLRKKEVPRYTQLGNAIPPLFGELAGVVLKDLLTNEH